MRPSAHRPPGTPPTSKFLPVELCKQLEGLLGQKESDYEQLLVMSHDANASKEAAKVELGKFESLVLDERKQRERAAIKAA